MSREVEFSPQNILLERKEFNTRITSVMDQVALSIALFLVMLTYRSYCLNETRLPTWKIALLELRALITDLHSDIHYLHKNLLTEMNDRAYQYRELVNRLYRYQADDNGHCSPECPRGFKGEPGIPGLDGIPGYPGLPGQKGEPGEPGKRGMLGEPGRIGEPGPQGPKGTQGLDGMPGISGLKGEMGRLGEPGLMGPKGIKGIDGEPGPKGPKGPKGDPGHHGLDCSPGKNRKHEKKN